MNHRIVICLAVAALSMLGPAAPAGAAPVVFSGHEIPGVDWAENFAFDGLGGMWVSRTGESRVMRYDPEGRVTASVSVPLPGGIALGPDGLVYINVPWTPLHPDAEVIRLDPREANPTLQVFASGLGVLFSNGLAADARGNLYITDQFQSGVTKVRADGTLDRDWTKAANVFGTNGIAVAGDYLYATVTLDPGSPIVRIPVDRPQDHEVCAYLATGAPRGLDDLTVAPDGSLYVTSLASPAAGDLFHVDPLTGKSTIVYSGPAMTSARFAHDFGDLDGELFLTTELGDILHIHV